MRLLIQTIISTVSLIALTAYADKNYNSEQSPPDIPANPDNFNGSNYSALTRVYTESGSCNGLPQVAQEVIYSGNTCMANSAGGVIVTCQYQGVPQYSWQLEFYSDDLACAGNPYINVVGTGTGCYRTTASDGRTVSVSVDCGGGTAAEVSSLGTFQTVQDTSLPTYIPGAAGSTSTGSATQGNTVIRIGTSDASTMVYTTSLLVTGTTVLAALLS